LSLYQIFFLYRVDFPKCFQIFVSPVTVFCDLFLSSQTSCSISLKFYLNFFSKISESSECLRSNFWIFFKFPTIPPYPILFGFIPNMFTYSYMATGLSLGLSVSVFSHLNTPASRASFIYLYVCLYVG
jgi:hypothetical protein